MKVKELIEELKKLDEEMPIKVSIDEFDSLDAQKNILEIARVKTISGQPMTYKGEHALIRPKFNDEIVEQIASSE